MIKKKFLTIIMMIMLCVFSSMIANATVESYFKEFNLPMLKGTRVVGSTYKETAKDYVWNKLTWMGKGSTACFYARDWDYKISGTKVYSVGLSGNINFNSNINKNIDDFVNITGYNNSWELVNVSAKGQYNLY